MASLSGSLVPFPFTPLVTNRDDGEAPLPLDARTFPALAALVPTFPASESRCLGEDVHELRSLFVKEIDGALARYGRAGMRAAVYPGRLDVLPWIVEDLAGRANRYDLPQADVLDVLEAAISLGQEHIPAAVLAPSRYPTSVERVRVEQAREARVASRVAAREAVALNREIESRKVQGATGLGLGVLVLRRGLGADRTKDHPLKIQFTLACTDGTDYAFLPLGKWTGIRIDPRQGVAGDPDLEIIDPHATLPGEWTQAQITAATKANGVSLIPQISDTIRAAREAERDKGAMRPEEGLYDSTVTGRSAIALAREWLRSNSAMWQPGDDSRHAMVIASVERITRGLSLHILAASDLWVSCRRQYLDTYDKRVLRAQPGGVGTDAEQADYFARVALPAYAGGSYLSPGELLPQVDEGSTADGDAWTNVLLPLLQGRDSVKADDLWLALRSAGLASVVSNLVSGRLTWTMAGIGWSKTVLAIEGKSFKGYRREVGS